MISFLNTFKRLQREKLISNRVRSSLFSSSTLRPPSMVKLIQGQPVSKCLSGLCRVHEKCVFKQEESSKCNLGRQTANKLSRGYGFLNSFPLPYPLDRSCQKAMLAAYTQSEKSSNTKNNRFSSETATKRMQSSEKQFLTFLLNEIKMKNKQFYSKYTAVLVWVIGGGHETSFEQINSFSITCE